LSYFAVDCDVVTHLFPLLLSLVVLSVLLS